MFAYLYIITTETTTVTIIPDGISYTSHSTAISVGKVITSLTVLAIYNDNLK